ncbi:hypothetical protein F511_16641 [Dorcoceras hygrometricum]|uniref:Uncharacterized protein n=1 Tax=Dorcoceras hygrometricum TaxID=472368 RepID=A0A2Z7A2S5_9LAMI|nr:hypothetical protein F511_16641 [Dorcoceras hygrometricum]
MTEGPNRKNDRNVLVAEESTKSWADTDSDSSSSSSSSSSDSEQEEVHCLMADQTSEDEVFDFANTEFTREDLIGALNDMVKEYRKLSHSFEEIKAENKNLKNSSIESSTDTLEDIDSFKTELSKLMMEIELLRNKSSELKAEIEKLNLTMSSWTKSSASLDKMFEIQKPASDRTGLGFSVSESSSEETSTQSQLVYEKFNKMIFVKASVIHDPCECRWRIRIPSPGGAAEILKLAPGNVKYNKTNHKPFIDGSLIVTLLASRRLAPTSFTRKPTLHGRRRDRNKSDHIEDDERRWPAPALGRADDGVCKRRWGGGRPFVSGG